MLIWEPLLFATLFAVLFWRTFIVRTLRFPDRFHEQAFKLEFDGARRPFDLISVFLQILVGASGVNKFSSAELISLTGFWIAINLLTALIRLWLILRRSELYVHNRSLINTTVTCCTTILYAFWVVDQPLYLKLHPLKLPYLDTWKALLLFPVMCAQLNLNYKATLSYKSITSCVALILATMVQASRCDRENASFPGRHEFYSSILHAVESSIQNLMPIVSAGPSMLKAGEMVNGANACRAVHATLAVSLCSIASSLLCCMAAPCAWDGSLWRMSPNVHIVVLNLRMVPVAACYWSPRPARHNVLRRELFAG